MTAISLDKSLLRYLEWPTICAMIDQLDESIGDEESLELYEKFRPGPEVVATRDALRQYMDQVWPGKYEEYKKSLADQGKAPISTAPQSSNEHSA